MRVSIYIVMFLVFFNGGALMLESTGAADAMGIDPAEGNDQQLEDAKEQARSPNPGSGIGGTLFGLYNSLAGTLEAILNTIMPGAEMLKANGFPDPIVNYLFGATPFIIGLDIIGYFRGWSLL
jgi:hypothetical protein